MSRLRYQQPAHEVQQSSLAGAVWTHEADDSTRGNDQGGAPNGLRSIGRIAERHLAQPDFAAWSTVPGVIRHSITGDSSLGQGSPQVDLDPGKGGPIGANPNDCRKSRLQRRPQWL